MKSTLLIAFLFACSMASFISAATEKAVMSQINRIYKSGSAMTPAKSLYDEDIKYCGTYETECIPVDIISMKQGMKVLGMMHKNPIYVANTISAYVDNKCTDSLMAERLTLNAALKVKNEATKDVELTVEKVTVLFGMEAAASAITCEEPLKVDTEYDITTIKCKDEEGKDPFADMKEMIGVAQPVQMTFSETTLSIGEDEPLVFNRQSDIGCTCAKDFVKPFLFSKPAPVREDVKFCGMYNTGCQSAMGIGMQASMKILGMMHKNPIYMQYPVSVYMGEGCTEENLMTKITMTAAMKAKNSEKKDMVITADKITMLFANEQVIASYKCSEPLELNKEYDVTTLDCKDEQGEDPFADTKALIGQDQEAPMEFGEDYLLVKNGDDQDIKFNRESDEGCTCAKKGLRDAF